MKVVNVHRPIEDSEIYYLVRMTPQEIAPLLPKGEDADKVKEGFAFCSDLDERLKAEYRQGGLDALDVASIKRVK